MFTSVIKKMRPYIITAIICFIISMVYEHFSHEVYSIFMIGTFAIPLIAGIVYMFIRKKVNKYLFTTGWITLLVGSYMKGVLEIFGTTNRLLIVYWIVGTVLILLSFVIKKRKK